MRHGAHQRSACRCSAGHWCRGFLTAHFGLSSCLQTQRHGHKHPQGRVTLVALQQADLLIDLHQLILHARCADTTDRSLRRPSDRAPTSPPAQPTPPAVCVTGSFRHGPTKPKLAMSEQCELEPTWLGPKFVSPVPVSSFLLGDSWVPVLFALLFSVSHASPPPPFSCFGILHNSENDNPSSSTSPIRFSLPICCAFS